MSKEEIRKLLGGYATNTLTANERSRLFEAALDDQELFNALQQEEALKSLLADPAARAQIRHALDNQPPARSGWRMRWWVWGGAVSAAAAAAAIFLVVRPNPARMAEAPAQIAATEKAPSPPPPLYQEQEPSVARTPARTSKQAVQSRAVGGRASALAPQSAPGAPPPLIPAPTPPAASVPAATAPAPSASAPPPIIPAPVQAQAVGSLRDQAAQSAAGVQMQTGVATAIGTGTAGIGGLQAPQIRYSLLKRTGVTFAPVQAAALKPGDLVRFDVSATKPGQLVLSRFDDSGKWVRIADLAVAAGAGYTFPDPPIQVTGAPQRYRLALETFGAQPQIVGDISGGPKQAMRAASAAQFAPAVVEITIAGKSGN